MLAPRDLSLYNDSRRKRQERKIGLNYEKFIDIYNKQDKFAVNGGVLKVRYKGAREITVRVLLMMDSGRSMGY